MFSMPEVVVNGISFTPRSDVKYKYDYVSMLAVSDHPELWESAFPGETGLTKEKVERSVLRWLILNDLFFVAYFVLGVECCNHPFGVMYAKRIEDEPDDNSLDIVARGHLKSTFRTKATTIQRALKYPEFSTILFSYKKTLAEKFLASIKEALETPFLISLFPEVLYGNPRLESPLWGVDKGIIIKRKNTTRTEPTVYASGLTEGMATGFHSEFLVYDDIETADMAGSIDVMNDCFEKFGLSRNLGNKTGVFKVGISGTFYHFDGPLARILLLKNADGSPSYHSRVIPGTDDGEPNGKPIFWTEKVMDRERLEPSFYSQILCDPMPRTARKLNPDFLQKIRHILIPKNVHKFIVVDPAGSEGGGDNWTILLLGVEPKFDDIGASRVFLMDAYIEPDGQTAAIEEFMRIYLNGGVILKVGVEKEGQATAEIHIANALAARGRRISVENGTLVILKSGKRGKTDRIAAALEWPLNNGKLFISDAVQPKYHQLLRFEMDKFPYRHVDGLDAWSYLYPMIKNHCFSASNENRNDQRRTVEATSPAGC